MKKTNHKQCKLQKGITFQMSWIPEKFAKVGKFVKLKDDDGWEVVEVYATMDSKKVQERSIDYRNQRKVSDI
jgi:hypothetical protein